MEVEKIEAAINFVDYYTPAETKPTEGNVQKRYDGGNQK